MEPYDRIYQAYTEDNSELLAEYLTSEDAMVVIVAERFDEYFRNKRSLSAELDANSCNLEGNSIAVVCAEIVPEYHDLIDSMEQSYSVPQAIFFAYYTEPNYEEENVIVDAMRSVIEGLEE